MIEIDREALAWAAGFFEGEGSTYIGQHARRRRGYLKMSIGQKHREALDRFHAAIGGLGNVTFNPSRPASPYSWNAGRYEHCQAVLAMLWPFMGQVKRDQARAALIAFWAVPRQSYLARAELARGLSRRRWQAQS